MISNFVVPISSSSNTSTRITEVNGTMCTCYKENCNPMQCMGKLTIQYGISGWLEYYSRGKSPIADP